MIALKADETEGTAFTVKNSGDYLIVAGLPSGGAFPTTVTLQMRFKDLAGNNVDWFSFYTGLSATSRSHRVQLTPEAEYRVTQVYATSQTAGAVVFIGEIKYANG